MYFIRNALSKKMEFPASGQDCGGVCVLINSSISCSVSLIVKVDSLQAFIRPLCLKIKIIISYYDVAFFATELL